MTESVTISREFAASRERVWQAVTERENFAFWFGTEFVGVPLDTLVFTGRPGDDWSAVMRLPDGTEKSWAGRFVERDELNRFVLTITDVPEEPENATPLTMEFSDTEQGTRLTITQGTPGFTDDDRAALRAGYEAFFDSMARVAK